MPKRMKLAWIVVLAACGGSQSVDDEVRAPAPCAVTVGPPRTLAIPARLAAIAPQYFHPSTRDDGFNDLVPNTSRYTWYDPSNLDVAVMPPTGLDIIWRATRSYLVGHGNGALAIARRGDQVATPIAAKRQLQIADVVEDGSGNVWILGPALAAKHLEVLRLAAGALRASELAVGTVDADSAFDHRIGITQTGRVAAVWITRATDGVAVMASWLDPRGAFGAPVEVDHQALTPAATELTLRSGVDLRVAADGADALAIAWRPLAPKPGEDVDLGSQTAPPSRAVTAEVRIVIAGVRGATRRAVHPTTAQPLDFTSGIGPWPLYGNGMIATTIAGHAVVFWIDDGRAVYATASEPPRTIAAGSFRLLPRRTPAGADELLLLQSAGDQQVAPIACR